MAYGVSEPGIQSEPQVWQHWILQPTKPGRRSPASGATKTLLIAADPFAPWQELLKQIRIKGLLLTRWHAPCSIPQGSSWGRKQVCRDPMRTCRKASELRSQFYKLGHGAPGGTQLRAPSVEVLMKMQNLDLRVWAGVWDPPFLIRIRTTLWAGSFWRKKCHLRKPAQSWHWRERDVAAGDDQNVQRIPWPKTLRPLLFPSSIP